MCPSSRCPIRRPRLYWLSWQLPAVDHYSVQRSRRVDALVFHPCEKRRRATAWISPGWSRDADTVCAALSAQGAATGAHWVRAVRPAGCGAMEESQVQISTLHYLWQNGLTKAKAWRCPGADVKERLLGFRPDLSRPALSTSADAWELESVRHRSPHGCARVFVLCIFQNHQFPGAHQSIVTLVNDFSHASDEVIANPVVDIIRVLWSTPVCYRAAPSA